MCIQRSTFDNIVMKSTKADVQRRALFANVSIREYDQTIGDSACCLEGAPITLDWEYQEEQEMPIDEYEKTRQPYRKQRSDLVLSAYARRAKLLENGVSLHDIYKAEGNTLLKKKNTFRKEPNRNNQSTNTVLDLLACTQRLDYKRKPTVQRQTPQLQNQMIPRAA